MNKKKLTFWSGCSLIKVDVLVRFLSRQRGSPSRSGISTRFSASVSGIGRLNTTVLMWGYESRADREARRGATYADPDWQEFINEIRTREAVLAQDVMIVNPVCFSPVVAMAWV